MSSLLSWFVFSFLSFDCSAVLATLILTLSLLSLCVLLLSCPAKLVALREAVQSKRDSLFFFLFSMRLFPFSPNFLVNLLSPIVGVPYHLFVASIFFGLLLSLLPFSTLSCFFFLLSFFVPSPSLRSFFLYPGLMPYNFACVQAGNQLASLDTILSPANLVKLTICAAIFLLPHFFKSRMYFSVFALSDSLSISSFF
jgi:uncharacterized membrane protein YdjX (TVP38/TMEM64 family)